MCQIQRHRYTEQHAEHESLSSCSEHECNRVLSMTPCHGILFLILAAVLQGEYIRAQATAAGNAERLTVKTCDINALELDHDQFDRVMSIEVRRP